MKKISKIYNKYRHHFLNANIVIGLLKILFSVVTSSLSFLISSIYSLSIGITKKNIFQNIKYKYIIAGIMLIISSILYINYSIYVIHDHKLYNYNIYTALLIAVTTFTEIVISIVGIIKSKNNDCNDQVSKLTNLATALISLTLTQTAILSFTRVGEDMSYYNGQSGIIFGLISMLIGIYIIIKYKSK